MDAGGLRETATVRAHAPASAMSRQYHPRSLPYQRQTQVRTGRLPNATAGQHDVPGPDTAASHDTRTFTVIDEEQIMPGYPSPFKSLETRIAKDRAADRERENAERRGAPAASSPRASTRPPRRPPTPRARSASKPGSWQRHAAESKPSVILGRYWHAITRWCSNRDVTWPIG